MSDADRVRWDDQHGSAHVPRVDGIKPPARFADHIDAFPTVRHALDLACGSGAQSVWLAQRGLDVLGVDVSPVAIDRARDLANEAGVGQHCRFEVIDLDDGLPAGPQFDVILCHRFRDSRLDSPIVERLAPGGVLAIVALSEVGATPGPYRASPGELVAAFATLDVIETGEADGDAWLLARKA